MSMAHRWDDPLEDGVYLGLPAIRYFRQETRGSSDWMRLFVKRHGWWWQSKYNPDWTPKTSDYQNYGSALHAIILEGEEAYRQQFAVQPDPARFPKVLRTTTEIKAALVEEGWDLRGTSKFDKAEWEIYAQDKLPGYTIWGIVEADFDAERGSKPMVKASEDHMLRFMRDVAIDPARSDNAEIRKLLATTEEHPALAEVSIFATIDGIRRRWRIDRMYPAIDMDLKSLGNWRGRPLKYEGGEVLARNNWVIQRADYHRGRTEAYRLIQEGRLFGGTVEERRYIRWIVEQNFAWNWIWLVYQKPELSGRAPVIFPIWDNTLAPDGAIGPLMQAGQRKLDKAIAFYRRAVDQFGFEQPWAEVAPMHFTEPVPNHPEAPVLSIPHWVQEDEPTEAEAYPQPETAE